MSESILVAALEYAAAGIPVFPVHSQTKAPLTPKGFYAASRNEVMIRDFWRKWPNAGIGMPTGKASGFDVLDLDVKQASEKRPAKDGIAAIERLLEQKQTVPDWRSLTPLIARTQSGGAHLYFRSEGTICNTTDKLATGVDTRGEGGYVILPPTPGYAWELGDLRLSRSAPNWPDVLRLPPPPEFTRLLNDDLEPVWYTRLKVAFALGALPNEDWPWEDNAEHKGYNNVGMMLFCIFNGDAVGLRRFHDWAAKSAKYDAFDVEARWKHWSRSSPPRLYGPGTLLKLADECAPEWRDRWWLFATRKGYEDRCFAEMAKAVNEGGISDEDFLKFMKSNESDS